MAAEPVTKEYLDESLDKLGRMIAQGFDENTEQHRQILKILDKHAVMLIDHTERLTRIEKKLENVVYRREFDELKTEVEKIREILLEKKIIEN